MLHIYIDTDFKRFFVHAGACSHEKATEYFVQAISDPSAFVAKQCASYYEYDMGLCDQARSLAIGADITPDDEGVYYLRTSPEVYTRQ